MLKPYVFINSRKQIRPYTDKNEKDGNLDYIHITDAWVLAEEIERLQGELGKLQKESTPIVSQQLTDENKFLTYKS